MDHERLIEDQRLRAALADLAPMVSDTGMWSRIQARVAARRRARRRFLPVAAAAVVTLVVLGGAGYSLAHWWPNNPPQLLFTDQTTATSTEPATTSESEAATATSTASSNGVLPSLTGTWQALPLPQTTNVDGCSLTMDPSNPNTLYAAIVNQGLFRSTDAGSTWTLLASGRECYQVLVDPASPATLYADGLGSEWGFLRSVDGGATWLSMRGPAGERLTQLWMDSYTTPTTLYGMGDSFSSLNTSTDGGATWTQLSAPGPVLLADPWRGELFCPPTWDSALPVGTGETPRLMRSTDAGATWEEASRVRSSDQTGYTLRRDPKDPSVLYMRIEGPGTFTSTFVSSDGAGTWAKVSVAQLRWAKAVFRCRPGTTAEAVAGALDYLATASDMLTDSDADRALQTTGDIIVDPADPSVLYVATMNGAYKSTDRGSTWHNLAVTAAGPIMQTLVVDPKNASTLYAIAEGSLLKSTDGGASWLTVFENDCGRLAIAPSDPSTLYVWTGFALYRSADAGASWTKGKGSGLPATGWSGLPTPSAPLLVNPDDARTMLLYEKNVLLTTDGGDTWTEVFTTSHAAAAGVMAIAADADRSDRFFLLARDDHGAGPEQSLYESSDAGKMWVPVASIPASGEPLVSLSPGDPVVIYLMRQEGDQASNRVRLWVSPDGGATWGEARCTGLTEDQVGGLSLFPTVDGATLYAIAAAPTDQPGGVAIYRSTDRGGSWRRVGDSALPTPEWPAQVVAATNGTLYLVTERSIYRWVPAGR